MWYFHTYRDCPTKQEIVRIVSGNLEIAAIARSQKLETSFS